MGECVFCRIIAGELASAVVWRDEHFIAVMDKYPIGRGHTLVMPLPHYGSILEMPPEAVGDLFIQVTKVAKAVKEATGAHGLNIGQNNGIAAHQIIPHVHVHVIPRYENDRPNWGRPSRQLVGAEELARWAEAIRLKIPGDRRTSGREVSGRQG